jgi:3-methyladenine DNA glycosylase AlkD
MTHKEVTQRLESLASHDPKDLAGMARFGINVEKAWVISIPKLRTLAKEILKQVQDDVKRHKLALQVWDSGIHEAKILAGFLDVPSLVTAEQMEKWVLGFDSWDVTDMVCGNLFDRTTHAVQKAREWSARPEEFVKRAGFVLMAGLAVHDKKMSDEQFIEFLEIIKRESGDNRNFVRKAVNWALRTIGKSRNEKLYYAALETAEEIASLSVTRDDEEKKAARFIAGDAIRELKKDYIKNRFGIK